MKTCKKCNKEFTPQKGLINFCSLECRNSRTFSAVSKLKKSVALLGRSILRNYKKKDKALIHSTCSICESIFVGTRKTCSDKCFKELQRTNASKQLKHGYGKSGYYSGIWCDSTYELIWLINNPSALRCSGIRIPYIKTNGSNSIYIPDFILNGTIYEIKGRMNDDVFEKLTAARKLGYNITLINDISWFKKQEKSLKKKFNVTCLSKLYSDYTPKYTYICTYCNNEFESNIKRKTTNKFCCNSHAGKFMFIQNSLLVNNGRFKKNTL